MFSLKRLLSCIVLLTSLGVLSGCLDMGAGFDDPDRAEIAFAPMLDAQTKAPLSSFPNGRTMQVAARYYPDGTIATGSNVNYFDATTFTYSTANGYASSSGNYVRYWPLDNTGYLNFLAYSTALSVSSVTWNANYSLGVSFVTPNNSTTQDDILVGSKYQATRTGTNGNQITFKHAQALIAFEAKSTIDYDATSNRGITITGITMNAAARIRYDMPDNSSLQDDVMFAFAGGRDCEAHENIPMVFRHAQAQVAVSAAANVNTANTGVSIRGIYLCNAKFSGLVEATPSGTDNITFSWSDVDGPVDAVPFWVASGAAQRLSVQPAPMGRGILVPEQSPAGTVSIRIDFTVHNGVKADGTTPDNTDLSYMYTIPSGNWLAGKKYQYVFTIGLSEITCEATVSETWDTSVSIPEVTL